MNEWGARERVIPAEVRGPIRNRRVLVHAVLLFILVALPWVKINGMQALLLDIPHRRFEIFGMLFLSHDAPLVFFLLILAALSLVFVTAVWGRVWCGWTCPQTVFIDALYRRLEIWIEGGYIERRKLAAESMGARKAMKIASKWVAYVVLSALIAHSLMAYFAGSSELIKMVQRPPSENWIYFLFAAFLTALLTFNFGWFREQFCIIMCPYGRLQGAMMDSRTVTILYDEKRGEPRKGAVRGRPAGDCVSCNRCVEVCPVKIDIRQGVQMECISCTACIDACNEIMRRVKKPEGLIRHASLHPDGWRLLRPRTTLYAALIGLFSLLFILAMFNRKPYAVMIVRAADAPFQILGTGEVLNHFKAHYMNQSVEMREVELAVADVDKNRGFKLVQAAGIHRVAPGESISPHVFISAPPEVFNASGEASMHVTVTDRSNQTFDVIEIKALGPSRVDP